LGKFLGKIEEKIKAFFGFKTETAIWQINSIIYRFSEKYQVKKDQIRNFGSCCRISLRKFRAIIRKIFGGSGISKRSGRRKKKFPACKKKRRR